MTWVSDDKNVSAGQGRPQRLRQGVRPTPLPEQPDALPSWKWASAYYGALVTRLSQVMAGEMKIDDAWAKVDQDVADKVAQAK
jgi:alpha-1,4-digalacturonate transport system substrate-binding protein